MHSDQIKRLRAGVNGKAAERRGVHDAIREAETLLRRQQHFQPLSSRSYAPGKRGKARPLRKADIPKDVKPPQPVGLFANQLWSQLAPKQRADALGMVASRGVISRPRGTETVPTEQHLDGHKRTRVWRKAPEYVSGVLGHVFSESKAATLGAKLDKVLTPTESGSYKLHADKVTLLYPNTPITPKNAPRYDKLRAEAIKDAAFVFVQSYEFTDQQAMKDIAQVAKSGVPVYAVVGEADAAHPAHKIWNKASKVNWVKSHKETQGNGRDYRIDHNKNTFIVKKDGSVVVFKGGINYNKLSAQNVDLGHKLEGGNVGLDVLGPMVRDYLRAGGKLKVKDLKRLSGALEKMINAKPTKRSIPVETAITSSHFAGAGKKLTPAQIDRELRTGKELFVDGKAVLKALDGSKADARIRAIANAAQRGKRIVISADKKTLTKPELAALKATAKLLAPVGVELVDPATIYIDNSTENVMHRIVKDAAARGESIWQGAFANSDGNFTKLLIDASKAMAEAHPNAKVNVLSADLRIAPEDTDDKHGAQINAGSNARLLFSKNFHGEVTGLSTVPGPKDEHGRPRKFHMKVLATHKPGRGGKKASGSYTLKSNNDSKHGLQVSEESSITVHSPKLAKEVISFLEKAKRELGTTLKPAVEVAKVPLAKRQTLTKRIVKPETKLKDMIFLVMDYETDGLSFYTDARLTEKAVTAYKLNARGTGLVEVKMPKIGSQYNTLINPGKDHYGEPRLISKQIQDLTNITNDMVRFSPEPGEVLNGFNNWVRTLEKKTGKTVMFVGHNFATFDRRAYNDNAIRAGVKGNPYMDGDVADTLRAQEKIKPGGPKKLGLAVQDAGIRMPTGGQAHRANFDIKLNAKLFFHQLKTLSGGHTVTLKDGTPNEVTPALGNLREVKWGDIRHVFISKTQLAKEAKAAKAAQQQAAE